MKTIISRLMLGAVAVGGSLAAALAPAPADAQGATCARTVVANVVAMDQPLMFNRLGAQNINGMMYALRHDVIDKTTGRTEAAGGVLTAGNVELRLDKRPRPLILRMAAGDCLQVNFQNLLAPIANPFNNPNPLLQINNQVADRVAGFHPQGLELVNSINDDSSFVGNNANSMVLPGGSATYTWYAPEEGTVLVVSDGATFGGEGSGGNIGQGLFGSINIQPKLANMYRSQVTEEELRLATTGTTPTGQPIVDYEARYPNAEPWISEGKAGLPILNMLDGNVLVHSDINAIITGPNADGSFPPSTYPLESVGRRNPAYPNRLEAFREFASIFHDETASAQAFPAWFADPVLRHTLHGVRDSFMINYGSGGIGSEIIANRLGVGPMYDCLSCAYEEFFLTAYAVGDPAVLVDIPANTGLEACNPALQNCLAVGPKATKALYPDDPANLHHSYTGDFVKFRNLHAGPKEQHIFHLHNHQWLFNPNDDNSNYIDAQGIGPGSGYTYEIANGGSGNRNKTAGDAIFHCHFYPHFAQGMWYMWRIHDVMETGTRLAASGADTHTAPFALGDGTPATGARALPDGEILVGTPIPAIVPLPGKAMAPMPGEVTVVAKDVNGDGIGDSSQALVVDRTKNPGFPFWIAGIEETVGQRPPTPPLDMITPDEWMAAGATSPVLPDGRKLFNGDTAYMGGTDLSSGGWDGGLPRHSLDGVKAGGAAVATQTRLDMSKVLTAAKPVYFPEKGTDLEQLAMAFHATRNHASFKQNLDGTTAPADFVLNGLPPVPGAPYQEPCTDDQGDWFETNTWGDFWGKSGYETKGWATYGADSPRVYKGAVIQIDAVFNKVGYHFPQQRIITLWDDVAPTLSNQRPPEPFVMRLNSFDCAQFLHTNLVPEVYELDDYQVRTPTDIIGQHIHLPKWDLTTADGSANGWNYEDGTLSPGMVRERIEAINHFNDAQVAAGGAPVLTGREDAAGHLHPEPHPYFGSGPNGDWLGARTTLQRWFADPVVNADGVDRGLGIIFTHDHYGPSTHQQIGLYSTVLVEPANSTWVHNETGEVMGTRHDGGPTSWQAAILAGDIDGDGEDDSYREFYFEYGDFQHAYEAGVFVGIGADGHTVVPPTADSFRSAINPSFRQNAATVGGAAAFPDIMRYPPFCPGGVPRPCPEAISADDVGMLVVNYRNEPIGLRVFDPNRIGPDGKPGMQAEGLGGDLAYALSSRSDRAIPEMNTPLGNTPYPALTGDVNRGDPFTPIMRVNAGDNVRVKIQVGSTEHEHNATIHGVKWLQAGSGFGAAKNSGWRNAQNAGISEQFTFRAPILQVANQKGQTADFAYSVENSQDGWWTGMWGVMRAYDNARTLFPMPNGVGRFQLANGNQFSGVCPAAAPVRAYDVTAVMVNEVFPNTVGATIVPADNSATMTAAAVDGAVLNAAGGTLVYNPRATAIDNGKFGPLHDPTAMTYVNTADLVPVDTNDPGCYDAGGKFKPTLPSCPIQVAPGVTPQPLTVRAAAGECIQMTVRNRLPGGYLTDADGNTVLDPVTGKKILLPGVPDLAGYNTLLGVVNRDRLDPQGLTTFNNNLIQPSNNVGIRPQLVSYDITRGDGSNVGQNPDQTIAPGQNTTYQWYAGDIDFTLDNRGRVVLNATPIEFGGANLIPADKVKQGQKALIGSLVVEPAGSTWVEDAGDPEGATVTKADGTSFREYAVVLQKGLNLRYGDATAVENLASEGQGIPEDSHDAGQQGTNYATEPAWFRFGIRPDAPFGNVLGGLGAVPNAHAFHSNTLVGGDPATPVISANAGDELRLRVLEPTGAGRGTTFNVHGHGWQRDPYVCPNSADLGLPGKCAANEVGSQAIGKNPIGMWLGHQESVTPGAHFDMVLPSAGGSFGVSGDYLFRDQASFGETNGIWGIIRVNPAQ